MQREQCRLVEEWGEGVTEAPLPRQNGSAKAGASPA